MGTLPESPDDLLTPTVVARFLGCSVDLVRYYSDDGRLPMVRTTTGRRLFRRADVDTFAAKWGGLHPGHRRVA